MNLQLRRKQIAVIALATVLAAASYWIPAPEETAPTSSTSDSTQANNV